jgi:hypothetical protein
VGAVSPFRVSLARRSLGIPNQIVSVTKGDTWSIKKFSLFQGPLTPLTLVTGSRGEGNTKSASLLGVPKEKGKKEAYSLFNR